MGPCRAQELKERAECTGVDRAKRAHEGLRGRGKGAATTWANAAGVETARQAVGPVGKEQE